MLTQSDQEDTVGWLVRQPHRMELHQELAPRSVQRRFSLGSGNTPAQLQRMPQCDRKDGGRALRQRSSGRRSMTSGSPPSRRRAARAVREVTVAAASRHGLATPHGGAGDIGIELWKGRVLVLYHNGPVPGGALILSVFTCTLGLGSPRKTGESSVRLASGFNFRFSVAISR